MASGGTAGGRRRRTEPALGPGPASDPSPAPPGQGCGETVLGTGAGCEQLAQPSAGQANGALQSRVQGRRGQDPPARGERRPVPRGQGDGEAGGHGSLATRRQPPYLSPDPSLPPLREPRARGRLPPRRSLAGRSGADAAVLTPAAWRHRLATTPASQRARVPKLLPPVLPNRCPRNPAGSDRLGPGPGPGMHTDGRSSRSRARQANV